MIKLYNGEIAETAMGCRIKTLVNCYGAIANAVDLYTDGTAAICRFENTVLASEGVDADELISFAEALGISEIEIESNEMLTVQNGWKVTHHPILYRDCTATDDVDFLLSLKDCFEVICSADSKFAQTSNYLYWLSDITRRQNCGCGKAYFENGASAVVSAVSRSSAYLSSVSVSPQNRKEGRASSLIKRICRDKMLSDKRLYTAAQTESVSELYLKNGFFSLEKSVIILKRSSF